MVHISLLNFTGVRCFQNAPRCRFFLDVRRKGREFREGGTGGVKEGEDEIEKRRKKVLAKEIERESTTERVGMDLCIPLGVKR